MPAVVNPTPPPDAVALLAKIVADLREQVAVLERRVDLLEQINDNL
jgi:hypothetical protein